MKTFQKSKRKNYSILVYFLLLLKIIITVVGSNILVESWWSIELPVSECRPRKVEEQQELGVGKFRDKYFDTHTPHLKVNVYIQPYNLPLSPCPKQPSSPKRKSPFEVERQELLLSVSVNQVRVYMDLCVADTNIHFKIRIPRVDLLFYIFYELMIANPLPPLFHCVLSVCSASRGKQ